MPPIRDLGDLFLPDPIKRFLEVYLAGNDRSLFYINRWSLVHAASGVATAWAVTSSFWTAFWIHAAWEILQLVIQNTPWTLRGLLDVVTDTVLFLGGFLAYLQVRHDEYSS